MTETLPGELPGTVPGGAAGTVAAPGEVAGTADGEVAGTSDGGGAAAPGDDGWVTPASFAQERVWLASQLAGDEPVYNVVDRIPLDLPLDAATLTEALAEVVRRHETLRSGFTTVDGALMQVVHDSVPVEPELIDLADLPEEERRERAARVLDEFGRLALPLDRAPLWRAAMVRLAPAEWWLAFVAHHTVVDATSQLNLAAEVRELCAAAIEERPADLPELAIQYADYAAWQRDALSGAALEAELAYWRERLADLPPVHALPTDRPRPSAPSFRGGEVTFRLGEGVLAAADALARRHRASTLMVLLAGLTALMHRLSGQQDIVVGALVAGRDRPELAPLIGMFVNNVVLRSDLSGDPSFDELVLREKDVVLEAWEHQDVPFHKVVEAVAPRRDPGVHPLFQVSLNYLPQSGAAFGNGTSRRDLSFDLTSGECRLEYSADLFDHATAESIAERYAALLADAVAHPGRRISELALLREGEREWLLSGLNDTARPYPDHATLHGLIEEQVARTPDAPALTFEGETITYAELNARANRIAHGLRRRGVGPETLVGVCAERSFELVAAILGVMKAGGAYVPLDPEYPVDRLAFLVEDARARVLLAQRRLTDLLPEGGEVLPLDDAETWAGEPEDNPGSGVTPDNIAYMIYTSGSTGRPKGVPTPHRAAVNHIDDMQRRHGLGPGDTMLQKTVMSADVSMREFIWPLQTGARMVLARPGGHKDAAYLRDLINAERVTITNFVPSMLAVFLEEDVSSCTSLRVVTSGGEALPAHVGARFSRTLPGCRLVNIYGPTETTMDVTWWPVTAERLEGESIAPLGGGIQNTTLYVLDAALRPQPAGVPGELCVGGVQVARGYHRRPSLTASQFVPDPYGPPGSRLYRTGDLARWRPDGTLEFLGRTDGQIKLRGLRIELGEIESALRDQPGVRDAAVLVREDVPGDKRLVGYLAVTAEPDLAELRATLRKRLPDHMVPSAFVTMERFPQTTNGKLDRKSLPAPEGRRLLAAEIVAPRTEVEREIAAIWTEVLGIETLGVDDDFFDLGGHSLLATQVIAKMRRITAETGRQVSVMDLFQSPTIRQLAALVSAGPGEERPARLIHELTAPIPAADRRVSYVCVPYGGGSAVVYLPLAEALPYGHSLYSVAIPGHDVGLDEEALPFDELAARCTEELLRDVEGPIVLYGHCGVGGALVIELARRLEEAGREVLAVYTGGVFPSAQPPGRFSRFLTWLDSKTSNRAHANWLKSMGVDMDEFDPAQADRIVANMRHDTRNAGAYFTRLIEEGAAPLRAPIISVVGERDPLTDYHQERYREWAFLTGTTALVVLEEAGHFFVRHRAGELARILTGTHVEIARDDGRSLTRQARGEDASWWLEGVSRSGVPAAGATPGMGRFLSVTAGQLVSMLGSALTQWAVPVWIYLQTGSLLWFGLFGVFAYAPGLIAMPLAGALADRYDRRRILLLSSVASVACELAMAGLVWTGRTDIGPILALVGLLGVASVFQRVAYTAAIPQLAPKRYLGHANGVAQLVNGTAMLVMPLIAAGLLAAIGLGGILVLDIVSYTASIGVLLVVRFPALMGRRRREPLLTEMAEGLRYSWNTRGFRAMLIYFSVLNLLLAAPLLLVSPLVLGFGTTADVGVVAFAEGLGTVLGGLLMSFWGGPRRRRMVRLMTFTLLVAACCAATGLRPSLPLIAFGMLGMGFGLALSQGVYMTIVQVKVPQRFHGRVISINQAISWAAFPLGFGVLTPLAGSVLEPLFTRQGALASTVGAVIGTGPGRGLAFAYLLCGVGLAIAAAIGLRVRALARLDTDLPDALPDDLIGIQLRERRLAATGARDD
ncbi:non-ribosomal peptide synthetase/MFS transporter [Bailinhaonella thermotolerans]|uniref:Amino acid adenylation domain-containing protein n=1 Tax=Bailinhaonella thermotolerans TaxID=1070861 RepID=A0A3A3ZZV8_9ACTN|nr:non-ribosomal peptide synthetase/MFS transporter [Bailinhaonella thermotolerans]RJL21434.1 amino acid adenylation domain-containing protein [Bailinhaonella thermotolerans]